jgi:glutamate dehydrogenase
LSSRSETATAALVGRVVGAIEARLGPRQAVCTDFARLYLARVDPEELAGRATEDLYGAVVNHWHLAAVRPAGQLALAVYNPDVEQNGWQSPHSVIDVVTDDMPFLVDSITSELSRHGLGIHVVVHPVMVIRREQNRFVEVLPGADGNTGGSRQEAFVHVEVDRIASGARLDELRADLERVLQDVRNAVEDWEAMVAATSDVAGELLTSSLPGDQTEEAQAFLHWLVRDHFTFLGYRQYRLETQNGQEFLLPVVESGLGILRPSSGPASPTQLSPYAATLARQRQALVFSKTNRRSTVDRPAHLDYIGIRRFNGNGEVTGEHRFLGLFTRRAYSSTCFDMPVVRRKAQEVVRRADFTPASHGGKSLIAVLETYPRDELLQASADELYETALGIVGIEERQQVRLFVRRDAFHRFYSCLVFLPRDRYTTTTRRRIEAILREALRGGDAEYFTHLSESVLARLHYVIEVTPGDEPECDVREVEARLAEATRTWAEDLAGALVDTFGEAAGLDLHKVYKDAFPQAYQDDCSARAAIADIRRIGDLDGDGLGVALYQPLEAPEGVVRLKVLRRGPTISLSEILPVLENMGVEVVDEHPYQVRPEGSDPVWIFDFGLRVGRDAGLTSEKFRMAFQDTVAKVWRGTVENDGFNRLVLLAGLEWRETLVLRAICKYLRQTGSTFSQTYMEQALTHNADLARQLVQLFEARFDPNRQALADTAVPQLTAGIEAALEAVDSLDEDRIVRAFLQLIQAMLRTTYYQADKEGLAFKLDPALCPDLPLPRPTYEVFVYSPRTEAVHLRGARVARGGIRWSDRQEDFRTEVLGLMKAQTVKNAVIVPMGAKGGFVVKRAETSRGAREGGTVNRDTVMAEVVSCYQTFMRGLLDLTDNLVGGRLVPPPDVVRYDGDDPYLVVAADKGTATFSDVANAVAAERGFWLGDAFASGGSSGYDHKGMGITARGAWESVRAHFRGLGIDVQSEPFTVVGIGDMSGDVFGNGMLLSRQIRLVGAFDHRHIFVDPDPDPAVSFGERTRLFRLSQSSWADYNEALLSPGGGVFPRRAKSIPISPELARRLDVEQVAMTPNQLIQALLRAPVDLLWNGGIGTYVKASTETQTEAGDRANDTLRVNATELRCRVVGEGGNLGFTQLARVEYALGGGLINTDAIDNSAGVDCSDHEVNIKVLLDSVVADGDLTVKQRNQLLIAMTDEVAGLVLCDNVDQTLALANAKAEAASMIDVHARYIRFLEQSGKLNRQLERLPSDDQVEERIAADRGLTTPELAVLLAYTKILAYEELLNSDLPEDPYLRRYLAGYFPTALRERYPDRLDTHPLRREIIATCVANGTVNRAGTSFLYRLSQETGASTADLVRAHLTAWEAFGMERLRGGIQACESEITAATATYLLLEGRKLAERAARWLVRNRRPPLDIERTVAFFADGLATLAAGLADVLQGHDRDTLLRAAANLVAADVPEPLALATAGLKEMFSGLDIVETASSLQCPVREVGAVYFQVGDVLRLDWLRDRITALPRADRWQTLARQALRDDLYRQHAALTACVLNENGAVDAWMARNPAQVRRYLALVDDIQVGGVEDVTTLSVALREVRDLMPPATTSRPN